MESLQLLMLYLVTGGAVAGVRYEVVPMANTTSGSFIIPNSNVIFLFSVITDVLWPAAQTEKIVQSEVWGSAQPEHLNLQLTRHFFINS